MANGSKPSLMERMRGKRTKDIRLPQEAHTGRDERLPAATPLQNIRENIERTRDALMARGPKKMAKRNGGRRMAARRA